VTPYSFKPMIILLVTLKGFMFFYGQNKYAFIPWGNGRDIRIDRIIGSGRGSQTGLVIEAKVEDSYISRRLFREYFLSGKESIDEKGYGLVGISNNVRSMTSVMHGINRIRRVAGLVPFTSGNRNYFYTWHF